MICAAPFLWFNDLCLPGGGPRWNLGLAAPLEWLVFYVWRRKMRARLGNKEKQRVSRWCTFKELNDSRRKWKYYSMSMTKSSVAPAVIVHHCATETEGKAKTAEATRFVSVFICSQMSRPDSVFFMFMLLIISAGRNPPTLPEISSFPRNSKKSVTLSSTATLQHRGRESVKGLDTNSA